MLFGSRFSPFAQGRDVQGETRPGSGSGSDEWLRRTVSNAVCVDPGAVSAGALAALAEAVPELPWSTARENRTVELLAELSVPYTAAAKLLTASAPASAAATAAFLSRSDVPVVDADPVVLVCVGR